MKVHFSVDLSYLCQIYIQKEYENLISSNDEEYNYIHYNPLLDSFLQKIRDEGIWNKETDEMLEVNFGDHWLKISEMIAAKFGEDPLLLDRSKWSEVDDWIKENIVLSDTFYPREKYSVKSQYDYL